MYTSKYTRVPLPGQGTIVMRCRVWNENLAAYHVSEPLASVPEPTIDAPASNERETDGPAW